MQDESDNDTKVIDLYIDKSPTPLEHLIHQEEEELIASKLPALELILNQLAPLDREIILLYYKQNSTLSYREMGRQLNVDYRKIQRRIPRIINYIEEKLR